jgi:hypothetical protein
MEGQKALQQSGCSGIACATLAAAKPSCLTPAQAHTGQAYTIPTPKLSKWPLPPLLPCKKSYISLMPCLPVSLPVCVPADHRTAWRLCYLQAGENFCWGWCRAT